MLDVDSFLAELKSISITNRLFTTKKVKILHAPSNANLKGTVLIDEELEKLLQKNSDIEYLNTANLNRDTKSSYTVSRYELFQLYQEADIVIDQVVIGWYGLQTVEALLSKSQVICYIDEDLKPLLFDECPIIQSSIEELQIKISETVTSIINKEIDFNKNIDWVKKHHGIKNNSSQLIDILK